jgi:hypothetical protein
MNKKKKILKNNKILKFTPNNKIKQKLLKEKDINDTINKALEFYYNKDEYIKNHKNFCAKEIEREIIL